MEDGKYALAADAGPVIGSHRVEIVASRKTGRVIKAVPPATGDVEETEQYLPSRYNTHSELTATIGQGDNVLPFELETE